MRKSPLWLAGLLLAAPTLFADEAENKAVKALKTFGPADDIKVGRDKNDPARPVIRFLIYNRDIKDENLKLLASLKKLQHLEIVNCPNVTDAGLKHLADLQHLKELNLGATQGVRGEGFKEFASWSSRTCRR